MEITESEIYEYTCVWGGNGNVSAEPNTDFKPVYRCAGETTRR